jgi:hypothetical protein
MSALTDDAGGMLTKLTEAQRGMTEFEIDAFLRTGEFPDLSLPPYAPTDTVSTDVRDMETAEPVMSEGESRDILAGFAPVTAGGNFFTHAQSHSESLDSDAIGFKFDKNQPRDSDGQWTDDVDADVDIDVDFDDDDDDDDEYSDDDDEYSDDDDEEFGANDGADITADLSKFTHKWTKQQQRAAYDYSDRHYEEINAYLRNGESGNVSSTAVETIRELRGMMRPTPQDVVTYRGVSLDTFGPDVTHENISDVLSGHTIVNDSFTSTSLSKNVVENHYSSAILFEINVPKGTPSVYIGDMTANESNDFELVIGDGTRMKIIDIVRNGQHQTIVRTRVIS